MAETIEVLTVVDIGSHSIKGVVVSFEGKKTVILAYSKAKSRGFEQGELKDIVALRESLEALLKDLSSQLPKRMESYFVISFVDRTTFLSEETRKLELGGADPVTIKEEHVYELFSKFSTAERLQEAPQENFNLLSHSRTFLHVIPQKYLLDETKAVLNPIDMQANQLGMKASIISMDTTIKESLSNAFAAVVGEKPSVFVSPFVSSEIVLNGKEKERGVVCVDIGHSFVSVSGYLNGSIFFFKPIEQGLRFVIKDIAQVFHTSFDEAERMLIQFGKVAIKDSSKELINYTLLDGKSSEQLTRSQLSIVIYAKIREIMNSVKREMRAIISRMMEEGEKGIPGGVVITGGGAKIDGMVEFLRDAFKMPVRVGHAGTGNLEIQLPDELQDSTFSGCFGSIYWFNLIGGIESSQMTSGEEKRRKKKTQTKTTKETPRALNKLVDFLKKLV